MLSDVVVHARIDEKLNDEANAVLATIGLTASDAFRLLMVRIAMEKGLPFEPLLPNEETIAAIEEGRRGDLPRFASAKDLMADLREGD